MMSLLASSRPLLPARCFRCALIPFSGGRPLHSSATTDATLKGLDDVPGPPPPPPVPYEREDDTVAVIRKKQQAAIMRDGRGISKEVPYNSYTHRRAWKETSVRSSAAGLQVGLDERVVRIVEPTRRSGRKELILPNGRSRLATAIALEWDLIISNMQAQKHHYIPLTQLSARALDIARADAEGEQKLRDGIVEFLLKYLGTDTLLCWAPARNEHDPQTDEAAQTGSWQGPKLRDVQQQAAERILKFLTRRLWPGATFNPILAEDSIIPAAQPEESVATVRDWLTGLQAFDLAGLERAVLATKSLLIAVRLVVDWSTYFKDVRQKWQEDEEPYELFSVEDAAAAASIEVDWQTGVWGEVEDTHDVDKEDIRRQLGSAVILIS